MTEKQEKILDSALQLFSEVGYAATSTSKVAKNAGVSEGLIFRHFENKEGLLNAILTKGKDKVSEMFASLEQLNDSKEVIRQVINLPFDIAEDQKDFWKLVYALKWQANVYDDSMSAPIRQVLVPAFEGLAYSNPMAEAELVLIFIDGLAAKILLEKPGSLDDIKKSFYKKYDL